MIPLTRRMDSQNRTNNHAMHKHSATKFGFKSAAIGAKPPMTNRWALEIRTLFTVILLATASLDLWADQGTLESRLSPKLRQFLEPRPAALKALITSISEAFSNRTYWVTYVYSDDDSEARAFHYYPNTIGLPDVIICLRENQQPLDEFITLVFEVRNSTGEKRFREITDGAKAGKLSKDQFVRGILQQEFEAIKSTRDSLLILKPSEKEKNSSYYYLRYSECPNDFEGFLSYTKRVSRKRDPVKEYEEQYELLRKQQ